MAKTISTHNGSQAHRAHNIRSPQVVSKEPHIDVSLSCNNETLVDEDPRTAYKRLFGEALREYNAKQTREDRVIDDYFTHVKNDKKKHPVYEMIIQVGNHNDTGITDVETEREIYKEFIDGWKERNPNLELVGAYIHADEFGGTIHAHLDYIPVAHGYKNGLHTQSALVRALGEQGFNTVKQQRETAQIRWERRENSVLEQICNAHGIEVEHPQEKRKHHEDTATYKTHQELRETGEQIQEQAVLFDKLNTQIEEKQKRLQQLDTELKQREIEIKKAKGTLQTTAQIRAKWINGTKLPFSNQVMISCEHAANLQNTAKRVDSVLAENEELKSQMQAQEADMSQREAACIERTAKQEKLSKRLKERESQITEQEKNLYAREKAIEAGEITNKTAWQKHLEKFAKIAADTDENGKTISLYDIAKADWDEQHEQKIFRR